MDETIKQRYAAEAKVLRSLYYFTLIISYGDVPFLTEVLARDEYNELSRTDQSIIYAQIEQDILESVDVLPVVLKATLRWAESPKALPWVCSVGSICTKESGRKVPMPAKR